MKVTFIPIVIGAFGTVTEVLFKGLEVRERRGRVDTTQTTTLLRLVRILKRVWRLEESCSHSNFCEKPLANADGKSCQRVNDNNDNTVTKKLFQGLEDLEIRERV